MTNTSKFVFKMIYEHSCKAKQSSVHFHSFINILSLSEITTFVWLCMI